MTIPCAVAFISVARIDSPLVRSIFTRAPAGRRWTYSDIVEGSATVGAVTGTRPPEVDAQPLVTRAATTSRARDFLSIFESSKIHAKTKTEQHFVDVAAEFHAG